MNFYPRRVPKDGQGGCDHLYFPVLGPDKLLIGQHCSLCDQFNDLAEVDRIWAQAAADAKLAKAKAADDKEFDHLSAVTLTVLTPLLLICVLVLALEHYGIIIFPPLGAHHGNHTQAPEESPRL